MDHLPVMPEEALTMLAIRPEGVYLDATAGLGGHTAMIAQRLTTGVVIANDQDAESLEMARRNTAEWTKRIRFHQGTFATLPAALAEAGFAKADGLLADLGVSRYQLTDSERGFSFLNDGPLDMRMDRSTGMTAADLVNHTAEKALADLIYQLGEERRARKIARAIVRARVLRSTRHLADVVERAVPRTGRLHPATRTFMALRMAVNDEQGELDRLLEIGPELLNSGGRMVAIAFMSIDDRKIKQKFRALGTEGRALVLTKHPLQPGGEEVARNPASRSAKLRALEMK
jgi:16S rRNA (cytosine1402-N4)-methyltransferase